MSVIRTLDADSLDGIAQPIQELIADAFSEVRTATLANEIQRRQIQILHGDLTEAGNGDPQVIDIEAILPANAIPFALDVQVDTVPSGGSVSECVIDVGGTTDPVGILLGLELITDVPTAAEINAAKGVAFSNIIHAGEQLGVTVTPDAGNPLVDLTAGDFTITVYFFVLAPVTP